MVIMKGMKLDGKITNNMTDLSKCIGVDGERLCKKKESCERFTSEALPKYQHWITMCVSVKNVDECRFFVDNKEK